MPAVFARMPHPVVIIGGRSPGSSTGSTGRAQRSRTGACAACLVVVLVVAPPALAGWGSAAVSRAALAWGWAIEAFVVGNPAGAALASTIMSRAVADGAGDEANCRRRGSE